MPGQNEDQEPQVVLHTVHGSHLSGLARPDSDWDWYTVVDAGKTRQRIVGDQDELTVTLRDFLKFVEGGEPQALSALWSPVATVDPRWSPLFQSLRPNMAEATRRFRGAIQGFGTAHYKRVQVPFEELNVKWKRHSLRLALFLDYLYRDGRFNPRLSDTDKAWIIQAADLPLPEYLEELRRVCPVPLVMPYEV